MRTDIHAVNWPVELSASDLAELLRPHIAQTAEEMARAIVTEVPEYSRPHDENYMAVVRLAAEQALSRFLDMLGGRGEYKDAWRDFYRGIGVGEMREGRSLDSLHTAMRLGARIAWRRLIDFAVRTELPTRALGTLAETTFQHLDAIAAAAFEGYAQAQAMAAGEVDRRRRRLLELMLADPPAAPEAISAAAASARWTEPSLVAVVVLDKQAVAEHPPPILSPEVLINLERNEPALIVPGPESTATARSLAKGLGPRRAAVGPAVPPRDALMSLRWARQALVLAQRQILPSEPLVWCREHLGLLLLFRDEQLLAQLVRLRLAPLAQLRSAQREPLADTLLAWLQLDRNAVEVAARLDVHPNTVRYRLRHLQQLFGDQLADPDARFELEIALRARVLLQHAP